MSEAVHRERPGLWPIWAWLAATAAAVAVLASTGDGDTAWGIAMASGVVGLFGLVPLVLGRRRYSTVTVTASELRVGRDSFALRDLDRAVLERQLTERLPVDAADMAGGAYAPTFGERHLLIGVAGRPGALAVPARDPAGLSRVLLDAAAAAPDRASPR